MRWSRSIHTQLLGFGTLPGCTSPSSPRNSARVRWSGSVRSALARYQSPHKFDSQANPPRVLVRSLGIIPTIKVRVEWSLGVKYRVLGASDG